jgi:hypothetical protein
MAKVHSVDVHVIGDRLAYSTDEKPDASSINVRSGDQIKWNCVHGDCTVQFKGKSPFDEGEVHGRKVTDKTLSTVLGKPASYKYDVTVVRPDQSRVEDDPEIIIDGD